MPETPNHGYNVPSEGTQDWHKPLNENFEQYDIDIEIRDEDGNKGNYDPKAGAKFVSTDTENVYIGDGSTWNHLKSTGRKPQLSQIDPIGDFVGIGRSNRIGGEFFGVDAPVESGTFGGMYINTESTRAIPFYGFATAGKYRAWQEYDGRTGTLSVYNDGYALSVDDNGNVGIGTKSPQKALQVTGDAEINGDLDVSGNKNFVQTVDTADGEREVAYTACEAPTPRTEVSGVAELEDGRAAVDLPDHFGWVTSEDEPLVVETTPYAVDSNGLAVVERSPARVVVEDLAGEGDYEFAYTVRGTREGHADKQVVREPSPAASENAATSPADD